MVFSGVVNYTVSSEQILEKYYGNGLGKKDKTSLGVK